MQDREVHTVDELNRLFRDFERRVNERFDELEARVHANGARFDKIDGHSGDQTRRFDRIDEALESVNGHVADVLAEIGGVEDRRYRDPKRKTVRTRLHDLEVSVEGFGKLASEFMGQLKQTSDVLNELREERDKARIINEQNDKRWGAYRVRIVTCCAVLGAGAAAVGLILRLAGVGS